MIDEATPIATDKVLEAIEYALLDLGFGDHVATWRARVAAAEKDAARYRWLRDNSIVGFDGAPSWATVVRFDTYDSAANTLDAAIDAAIAAAPITAA